MNQGAKILLEAAIAHAKALLLPSQRNRSEH